MRYMVMHKTDALTEAGERPSQELIQAMGQLVGRSLKAGIFKDGAGLHRSATRARVRFAGGTPSVVRGPYPGGNELLADFAMITTTGIERAIEMAIELSEAAGGREVEVGPVVEGWDLNGRPRPADAPHRFLLFVMGDAGFEAGAPRPAAIAPLFARWERDGVLQSAGGLKPTKHAARTRVDGGKRHWIDGPFAETKELISGFSILEVPSFDDARRFTEEYAAILGDHEVDVRELA
jgi:hypothetical protein